MSQGVCKLCAKAGDETVKEVSSNKHQEGHALLVASHSHFNFCALHLDAGRKELLRRMGEGRKRKRDAAMAAAPAALGGAGAAAPAEKPSSRRSKTTDGKLRKVHDAAAEAIKKEVAHQRGLASFKFVGLFFAKGTRGQDYSYVS